MTADAKRLESLMIDRAFSDDKSLHRAEIMALACQSYAAFVELCRWQTADSSRWAWHTYKLNHKEAAR